MALAGWVLVVALLVAQAVHRRRAARRLARACHEVRGPLTAARLAVAAAERRTASGRGALRAADRELARAGALLADVQGAAGPDADEPVELSAVVRRAADAWRPAARLAGRDVLVVAPGVGLRARGDGGRLQQAVSNLVHNAVEHGRGLVLVGAREAEAGGVQLEVADAGPGLPAGALRREGRGPRGHGLAVAAEIAVRHGGGLEAVHDEAGHRVILALPRLDEDAPPLPRTATATVRAELS